MIVESDESSECCIRFCVASIDCFSDGGRSVAVNTSGCGPEDRGFESLRPPHHRGDDGFVVLVVGDIYCCARSSGDRASGFEPEGRGFESLRACHIGFTAIQLSLQCGI